MAPPAVAGGIVGPRARQNQVTEDAYFTGGIWSPEHRRWVGFQRPFMKKHRDYTLSIVICFGKTAS